MTALDDAFGPRRHIPTTADVMRPTRWHKSPEFLRPTLEAFETALGYEPPSRMVEKQWEVGARAWYEAFQNNHALLRTAIAHMRAMAEKRGQAAIIKSPQSCITVALALKGKVDERAIHFGTDEAASAARRRKYGVED